jgi:hypothetical protein
VGTTEGDALHHMPLWNDAPRWIYSKHEDATYNTEGGGMGGYSINDCIAEQKRLNRRYFDRKRDQADTDWKDEHEPKAKAARTDTGDTTAAGGAADDANAEDTDKANDAIFERWYGMRGNKSSLLIQDRFSGISLEPVTVNGQDSEGVGQKKVSWKFTVTIPKRKRYEQWKEDSRLKK